MKTKLYYIILVTHHTAKDLQEGYLIKKTKTSLETTAQETHDEVKRFANEKNAIKHINMLKRKYPIDFTMKVLPVVLPMKVSIIKEINEPVKLDVSSAERFKTAVKIADRFQEANMATISEKHHTAGIFADELSVIYNAHASCHFNGIDFEHMKITINRLRSLKHLGKYALYINHKDAA
jgi:hypothetical protein